MRVNAKRNRDDGGNNDTNHDDKGDNVALLGEDCLAMRAMLVHATISTTGQLQVIVAQGHAAPLARVHCILVAQRACFHV